MMKILWFLESVTGRVQCRLNRHKTAGVSILYNSSNPAYSGTRLRCVRCGTIVKEEAADG